MTNAKRLGLHAALGLMLAAPSTTLLAAGASFDGVFGDVYYNQKIDDLRGAEIEIRGASAEFITCPGYCLDIVKVPLKLTGDRIAFEYSEPSASPDGAPTLRKYAGVLKGNTIVLTQLGVAGAKPHKLLRRPERYALDIAVEAHTDHGH